MDDDIAASSRVQTPEQLSDDDDDDVILSDITSVELRDASYSPKRQRRRSKATAGVKLLRRFRRVTNVTTAHLLDVRFKNRNSRLELCEPDETLFG